MKNRYKARKKIPGHIDQLGELRIKPLPGENFYAFTGRIELTLVMKALKKTNNQKTEAAKLLGNKRTTLVELIKREAPRAKIVP